MSDFGMQLIAAKRESFIMAKPDLLWFIQAFKIMMSANTVTVALVSYYSDSWQTYLATCIYLGALIGFLELEGLDRISVYCLLVVIQSTALATEVVTALYATMLLDDFNKLIFLVVIKMILRWILHEFNIYGKEVKLYRNSNKGR